jgi:succinate dehydrogenase / fumarate reductase iron-sulfur subunit
MTIYLKIWTQEGPNAKGAFQDHTLHGITSDMSFLEMLDILNEDLIANNKRPIEFESDCREGICGTCGLVINGQAHGPGRGIATCQLHMRKFTDKETITIEPWRAKSFPIIRDLVVDRSALDRIITRGGYISAKTGEHADANAILVPKHQADRAMDAAACIGCGACVAACPNASASLFLSAKVAHMALLPQGQAERLRRVERMVHQHDAEHFGACSNIGECEAACPKEISIQTIALMRSDYRKAMMAGE